MGLYFGISCADCGVPFLKNDDVVVCPICGAPHHRDCYAKTGRCKLANRHAPDFLWQPQHLVLPKKTTLSKSHLHTEASKTTENYCDNESSSCHNDLTNSLPHTQTESSSLEFSSNDGITEEEYAAYIGPNSFYFINQFNMPGKTPNFYSWNWPAFFLESLYFFYRKMYGIGTVLMIFVALINIPGILLNIENLLLEHPDVFGNSLGYSEQTMRMLDNLSNVGFVLYFICRITSGIYANRLFKLKSIQEINEIRSSFSENPSKREYLTALYQRGKPSVFAVMLALSVQFAIVSALSRIFL